MKKIISILLFAIFLGSCVAEENKTTECISQFGYQEIHFDIEWQGTWKGVDSKREFTVSEHNITIDFPDGTTRSYCHAVQYATQHAPNSVFNNNLMIEPQMFVIIDNNAYNTKRLIIHQGGIDIINEIYARIQ